LEGGLFVVWFWEVKLGRRRRRLMNNLVFGNSLRDIVVVGNFGLRGQETARILGAREPKRLFLVGWEVNTQFGQLSRIINNQERAKSTKLQVEVDTLCIFVIIILLDYYVVSMLLLLCC
jgi:hypothetical protein